MSNKRKATGRKVKHIPSPKNRDGFYSERYLRNKTKEEIIVLLNKETQRCIDMSSTFERLDNAGAIDTTKLWEEQ